MVVLFVQKMPSHFGGRKCMIANIHHFQSIAVESVRKLFPMRTNAVLATEISIELLLFAGLEQEPLQEEIGKAEIDD